MTNTDLADLYNVLTDISNNANTMQELKDENKQLKATLELRDIQIKMLLGINENN